MRSIVFDDVTQPSVLQNVFFFALHRQCVEAGVAYLNSKGYYWSCLTRLVSKDSEPVQRYSSDHFCCQVIKRFLTSEAFEPIFPDA